MRIQILSDLHREMTGVVPVPDAGADVVVMAGDIAAGADGVTWAGEAWPDRPVVYVTGNHEYYDGDADAVLAACREAARGTRVHVLERDRVDLGPVRFLGATLWSDFALHGARHGFMARRAARRDMPDFRLISHDGAPATPESTVEWHARTRAWLDRELARGHDGPTVVVTHHAPHPKSNHYGEDEMSPAFVSDLSALIAQYGPELWVHGHTHSSEDYRVGATRIVANQAGYASEATGWDPHFVITVDG